MTSHNHQKKIAVIGDLSGFGRCSIAVSLPVISQLGIQCCPLPTSIFSNHTGFPSFYFDDYTDHMEPYMAEWRKLHLEFEGICTGFLGSIRQIEIVQDFFRTFSTARTTVLVDPVMGDYGRPYATYTMELCQAMKALVSYADILTPNLTEACILTDTPYRETWTLKDLSAMAEDLSAQGPGRVVLTGIPQKTFLVNLCYERGRGVKVRRTQKVATQRSGTGDLFAAIVAAGAVRGIPFSDSVQTAAKFIQRCIRRSEELSIPVTDGVCFEELLSSLHFH